MKWSVEIAKRKEGKEFSSSSKYGKPFPGDKLEIHWEILFETFGKVLKNQPSLILLCVCEYVFVCMSIVLAVSSPMALETEVQSQVESYQGLKK